MANRKNSVRVGDVFKIPIDEDRVSYGQVVADRIPGCCFVVTFVPVWARNAVIATERIVSDEIRLALEVFDALLVNGSWPVVGNIAPDVKRIGLPIYSINVGGDPNYVEDFRGRRRRAKPGELELLGPMHFYSPKVLEDAVKAANGIGPWRPAYEAISYANHCRAQQVELGSGGMRKLGRLLGRE